MKELFQMTNQEFAEYLTRLAEDHISASRPEHAETYYEAASRIADKPNNIALARWRAAMQRKHQE